MTQSNLGQALRVLGERDNDRDLLAEAVTACRAALDVYTREATPLEWAMASTNLANALAALNDSASIEEAIAIYREAIATLDGPARLQQRAIARYNLKRAEGRLAAAPPEPERPPSMTMCVPVMSPAKSEHRYITTFATSSGIT